MADLAADHAVKPPGRLRLERSARILEAAEIIFAAKGFDATTTADIAAAAQLPKANVHYYFGTKEKIYRTVLDNILHLWLSEADSWITPEHDPREALEGYIRAKILLAREKPEASRIYASELLRGAPHIAAYLQFALRNRVTTLSHVIDGWIRDRRIREVEPAHLFFCIWAMTQTYADFSVQIGAVLDKTTLDDSVYETAARTICAMVLGGLLIETKKDAT